MSYEILYTSAPSGLKPGSSGYCTVQGSRGIPAPAVDLLESLSGYRHVFTPGSPEAKHNPVNWGHYLIRVAGRVEHVLSRVGDCDLDYTGRSNKLAHHLVVDAPTTATLPGGPAWFLSRPGLMYDQWDGTVSHLGTPRIPPPERRTAGQCAAWGGATGDAGWGGVLAESFLADPERKVFVVYAPGTNVLALFEEAIALLPEHRRWDVTFATYGAALPKTVDCLWSGLVAGSPEVAQSHRFVNALRIDLTNRMGRAAGGPLVDLARTGVSTASTRPTTHHQSNPSPHPLPAEPIYEGGYQPVPPPPGVFPAPMSSDGPEPPSLPSQRNRNRGSHRLWWILLSLSLLLLVGIGSTAVLIITRKWQPQLQEVAKSDDGRETVEGAGPAGVIVPTSPSDSPPSANDVGRAAPKEEGDGKTVDQHQEKDSKKLPGDEKADGDSKMESPVGPDSAKSDDATNSPDIPPQQKMAPPSSGDMKERPEKSDDASPREADPNDKKARKSWHTIVAERVPTIGGKPGDVTSLKFANINRVPISKVSRGNFLIPHGRDDQKTGGSYHTRGEQYFEGGVCNVFPKGALRVSSNSEFLAHPSFNEGVLSLDLKTTQAIPNSGWRECLSRGVVVLEDADSLQSVVIVLAPPTVEIAAIGALSNLVVQKNFPESIVSFTKVVSKNDIYIEDLMLSVAGEKLRPSKSNAEQLTWDVSEKTNGFIETLHLERRGIVSPNNQLKIVVKSKPDEDAIRITFANASKELTDTYNELKTFCGNRVTQSSLQALTFTNGSNGNESRIKAAETEVEELITRHFNEAKPMNQGMTDTIEEQKAASHGKFSRYMRDLRRYWANKKRIDLINREVAVVAGRIKYVARPLLASNDGNIAELPEGASDISVDLWVFGEQMSPE